MIELYNGDCLEVLKYIENNSVVLKHNENNSIDFAFTSPPYNRERNDKYANINDKCLNYFEFLKTVVELNLKISKYLFLNVQKDYYNKADIFKLIGEYSNKIIDIIVWTKSNPMPASGLNLTNAYEFILIMSNTEKSIKCTKTYTKNHIETSVYSENPYKKIHRAVMKPRVVEYFIDNFTKENNTILDCFMGLGTTGIEAKRKNRNFIGIELDKNYYEIAKNRMENTVPKI